MSTHLPGASHVPQSVLRSHTAADRRALVIAHLMTVSREHITRAMYAAGRAGDDRERERLASLLDEGMG